jgi:hypothetical protein
MPLRSKRKHATVAGVYVQRGRDQVAAIPRFKRKVGYRYMVSAQLWANQKSENITVIANFLTGSHSFSTRTSFASLFDKTKKDPTKICHPKTLVATLASVQNIKQATATVMSAHDAY